MTPIKAAADPSNHPAEKSNHALANELDRYREGWPLLLPATQDLLNSVAQRLRRLSAPAGNAGVVNPDGFNGCMRVAAQALDFLADHERPVYGQQKYNAEHLFQLASELRKTSAAIAALQPREAFAAEIKRADAAPPEASFDNASDMLGYLNAPAQEAAPVAWRYVWPDGAVSWYSTQPGNVRAQPVYVSPSPIPEGPGGRDPATIEACALIAEGFDAACDSPRMKLFVDAGLVIAVYKRDGEIGQAIRALKPQDGGESGS